MNKQNFFPVALLVCLFSCHTFAFAQQLQIRNYGTKDGIPQSEVDVVYQDRAGQMWFGTFENGVARYDGKTMQAFTRKQGLPNLSIRSIYQDHDENIWLGTEGGAARILLGDSIQAFTTANGLPGNFINWITEDSNRTIWFATPEGLASLSLAAQRAAAAPHAQFAQIRFQTHHLEGDPTCNAVAFAPDQTMWVSTSNGIRRFQQIDSTLVPQGEFLAGYFVRDLLWSTTQTLWAGTPNGLFRYQNDTWQKFSREDGLLNEDVFCLGEDQKHNIWIGTRTGLFQYDGKKFTCYDTRHGLPNAYIRSLLVDYENNLWLGTWGGGVGKIYGWAINNYEQRNGLPANAVFAFMQDREQRVWIGTNGGGIAVVSGAEMTTINTSNGLPNNVVRGMTQTPDGDIWVATHGGAARRHNGKWQTYSTQNGLPDNLLRHVYAAPNGDLWFSSAFKGALRLRADRNYACEAWNMSTDLPSNSVHQVYQDRSGRIWFATDHGVYTKADLQTAKFVKIDSLAEHAVYTIFEDHTGALWFGTRAVGAVRFDGQHFERFDVHNGLPNNVVYFVAEDAQQNIWFGTNAGVARYDGKNFFYLNGSDGLLDDECNTRAVLRDAHDFLWVGTIGGASRIATAQLVPALLPPRVKITALEVNGKKYFDLTGDRIRAPYQSTITLHFATLSFVNEDKVKNRVFLEGFDQDTLFVQDDRSIRYTNLLPKRYTFHLRGENAMGVPSHRETKVEFQILAPFYLTFWFLCLSVVVLAGLIFGVHRWRVRQVKARAVELEQAVTTKTEELQHTLTFLATIKEFLPLGLLVIDAQETVVEANRAALDLFESDFENLRGRKLFSLLRSPVANPESLWRVLTQKKAGLELLAQTDTGKHFVCEIHSDRVVGPEGNLRFLILTCENIEAQKELEKKFIDHEKQAALVNLVAGMGEVLNQKLLSVSGNVKALHEQLQNGAQHSQETLHHTQSSVQEMDKLLRQLLDFTAYLTKTPSLSVDLRQELQALRERWAQKIGIVLPEMTQALPVRILSKLRDGLDEALQNSLDAGAHTVKIEVELLLDHARVRVSLADDGEGISNEIRHKAFLPFFKTRGTPHAGLGLWKLHQVVQQCGGSVALDSLPSGGTLLHLTLPVDIAKYKANLAAQAEAERHAKSRSF